MGVRSLQEFDTCNWHVPSRLPQVGIATHAHCRHTVVLLLAPDPAKVDDHPATGFHELSVYIGFIRTLRVGHCLMVDSWAPSVPSCQHCYL